MIAKEILKLIAKGWYAPVILTLCLFSYVQHTHIVRDGLKIALLESEKVSLSTEIKNRDQFIANLEVQSKAEQSRAEIAKKYADLDLKNAQAEVGRIMQEHVPETCPDAFKWMYDKVFTLG